MLTVPGAPHSSSLPAEEDGSAWWPRESKAFAELRDLHVLCICTGTSVKFWADLVLALQVSSVPPLAAFWTLPLQFGAFSW